MSGRADTRAFRNPYRHGFLRVATASPIVHLTDPAANAAATLELVRQAHDASVGVVLFPELGLSGYAIDDLLQQSTLQDAVDAALCDILEASGALSPVIVLGAPIRLRGKLYNCGVVIHRGRLLAVTPKSFLPNYREFYEARQFAPASAADPDLVEIAGQSAPFGSDVIVDIADAPGAALHVEICEDVWVPNPPSSAAALAGATVLLNLSASNVTIGKSDYRHALCRVQSSRCMAAYLYSAAGGGESTTDLAWDGHAMIYESGELLGEAQRFSDEPQLVVADVDVERLQLERARTGTFGDAATASGGAFRRVATRLDPRLDAELPLARAVARFPFVPAEDEKLDALCYEAFNIQVAGLRQRLEATGLRKLVIGVSGGLDSTHALLVACRAFDALGWDRAGVLAYTLPAFATSDRTKANAWALMRAVGVSAEEIDLTGACRQMLADIGHPAADGAAQYDIAFENVQAGARTSVLFRLANHHGALVLGTGDLSELALGWCTYGVGDQMAHYNVNASVPKTLIQHLIRWCAATGAFGAQTPAVLDAILATEISPELVPGADDDQPAQLTEEIIGPYALHDFFLFYTSRYGLRPSKVAYLAEQAFADANRGAWPPNMAPESRKAFDRAEIKRWLAVFLKRFFQTSQFKRSAMPNGPKVASGGALSPRGDWRAPSDSSARIWLDELQKGVPDPD